MSIAIWIIQIIALSLFLIAVLMIIGILGNLFEFFQSVTSVSVDRNANLFTLDHERFSLADIEHVWNQGNFTRLGGTRSWCCRYVICLRQGRHVIVSSLRRGAFAGTQELEDCFAEQRAESIIREIESCGSSRLGDLTLEKSTIRFKTRDAALLPTSAIVGDAGLTLIGEGIPIHISFRRFKDSAVLFRVLQSYGIQWIKR